MLNKTSLPFQNPPKFKQIQVKFFQVVARKESLMIGISLAAGATFVWFVSLPADQLLHHPRMNPTGAIAAEAQRVQERFEQERNAEIDASIAAVAAQRAQERFEQERNAEIDTSIAAVAARRVQERFEQARNAEIDASIAAVAARRVQERFEQERNAEIDASIAAVAARRAQERFEQQRKAEIDASITAITNLWLSFADMQLGSFAQVDGPEQPWQP
jgi:hypothetical protein